jgi:hypothetical protein
MADETAKPGGAKPAATDPSKADAAAARQSAVTEAVNAWLGTLNGGPLSRATDAYNQVFEAKADLVKRIVALG